MSVFRQPSLDNNEHSDRAKAKRVIVVDPFGGIQSKGNFTIRIDETTAGTTYVGKAQIGTDSTDAEWQIQLIFEDSGNTSIKWADGTDGFTKVWEDRTSYTYS